MKLPRQAHPRQDDWRHDQAHDDQLLDRKMTKTTDTTRGMALSMMKKSTDLKGQQEGCC
jgi:hypothetical protein